MVVSSAPQPSHPATQSKSRRRAPTSSSPRRQRRRFDRAPRDAGFTSRARWTVPSHRAARSRGADRRVPRWRGAAVACDAHAHGKVSPTRSQRTAAPSTVRGWVDQRTRLQSRVSKARVRTTCPFSASEKTMSKLTRKAVSKSVVASSRKGSRMRKLQSAGKDAMLFRSG